MDAIELLTKDHDQIKGLLKELMDTTPQAATRRTELLGQIQRELEIHTELEEKIFYPSFKSVGEGPEDDRLYFDALAEHHAVGGLMVPDLMAGAVDSEEFSARVKVLQDLLGRHIDAEEGKMFERTKLLMHKGQLEALAERLERHREILLRSQRAMPS